MHSTALPCAFPAPIRKNAREILREILTKAGGICYNTEGSHCERAQLHSKARLCEQRRICRFSLQTNSGCGAVGSAGGLGPSGRRFEPCHSDHKKQAEPCVRLVFYLRGAVRTCCKNAAVTRPACFFAVPVTFLACLLFLAFLATFAMRKSRS